MQVKKNTTEFVAKILGLSIQDLFDNFYIALSKNLKDANGRKIPLRKWLKFSNYPGLILLWGHPLLTNNILNKNSVTKKRYFKIPQEKIKGVEDNSSLMQISVSAKSFIIHAYQELNSDAPEFSKNILIKIILNKKSFSPISIKLTAISKLSNQNTLAKIVRDSNQPEIVWSALEKIRDDSLLFKVVADSPCWDVKIEAVKKIKSEKILEKIVFDSKTALILRRTAAVNISHPETLLNILLNVKHKELKEIALENLSEIGLMKQ